MKKFRLLLIVLAVTSSFLLAFKTGTSTPLDKLKSKFTCSDYGACQAWSQYVYWGGQMYQVSAYGQYYYCVPAPGLICTYAYVYCPATQSMEYMPCRMGRFCKITPNGCESTPLDEPPSNVTVKLTDAQRKKVEEVEKLAKTF